MNLSFRSERFNFARDSLLMVGANSLSGLFYLLVHVLAGRLMGNVEYGQLVALLGLLNVLGLPAGVAGVVMARYVAEYAHGRETQLWVTVVKRALRKVTVVGFAALLIWCLFSGVTRGALNAPSSASIVVLGCIGLAMFYSPIMSGTLQGAGFFGWLAAAGLIGAGGRLLFAWVAAAGSGTVTSVMTAVLLSVLLGLGVSYIRFHGVLRSTPSLAGYDTSPIYRYLWGVFFGQGALFLLLNADIVLSARFLSEQDLAVYGKAAMLSRTVIFLPQPVALAMFPRAVNSRNPWLLAGPLIVSLIVGVFAAGFISIYPEIPMRLMYGVSDQAYLLLVRRYVWAAIPLSLCAIVAQYLWARKETSGMLALIPVALVFLAALFLFHSSPVQMIWCLGAGGAAGLAVMAYAVLRLCGRRSAND